MTSQQVTVIGAGVAGLTCAVALAERGHRVEVVAREVPGITSVTAASLWALPFVEQSERVHRWARTTHDRLRADASDAAGIRPLRLTTLARDEFPADAWMSSFLPRAGVREPEELPRPYTFGPYAETVLIDTSRFLPWLCDRLARLHGTVREESVSSLEDVPGSGPIVLAAGSDSGRLVGDAAVSALEASVIRVPDPGILDAVIVRDGPLAPLFIVPRFDDVVLGGAADEHPEVVLERAAAVEPRLAGAHILSHARGVRPMRGTVRVEADTTAIPGRRVVHCYGHGGAGFSICWGTARSVVELVEAE